MKRKFYFTAVLMMVSVAISQVNAQEWVVYDGSVSPDSVFDWSGSGMLTDTVVEDPDLAGNMVYQYQVTEGSGNWRAPLNSPMGGITLVARVMANLDPGFQVVNFSLRNGVVRPDIRVEDDKLNPGGTSENLNYDLDMYEWHVIRMTLANNSSLFVYVDENPVPVMIDTANNSTTNTYIQWGDGSGSDDYGGLIDWMVFDTTGTYAPGEGAPIPDSLRVVPSSIAGMWKMDDGTGTSVSDELGMSDGTLVNGGDNAWVEGYIGTAIDMTSHASEDTSTFVSIPGDAVSFDSTQSFSFSVIAKGDVSDGAEQSIISKGDPARFGDGWYHLSYKNGAVRFMVWDGATLSSPEGIMPDGFPVNDWVHIVCVRDVEQDSMFVYLNGMRLDAIKDLTDGDIVTEGDLYIGMVPGFTTQFRGAIDEVTIFNKALAADEILAMAEAKGFAPVTNMAGYWKMDDGSGTTVTDETGNSDGTLVNGGDNAWVEGYIGTAIDMTSHASEDTSTFVSIPGDAVSFDSTQSFSFSVIAKGDVTSGDEQTLISKGDPARFGDGWYHLSYKGGAVRFMVWDGATLSSPEGVMPDGFPVNDWVHIVCVRDVEQDSMFVYLNGVRLDAIKDLTDGDIVTEGDLYIGMVPGFTTQFRGAIDEVAIYTNALSPEEVLQMAADAGFEPIVPPSVVAGYWKMDDGSGTTVTDEMGASDGLLVNGGDNAWVEGYIGTAIDMTSHASEDTSTFVSVPGDAVSYDSTQSFSFSVVVKGDVSDGAEQSIISKGDPARFGDGWYHLSYKGGAVRFMVWDGATLSSPEGVMPEGFPVNDWVHIVCVRDVEQDSMFVYLNGVRLDAIKDLTDGNIETEGDLYIGMVPGFTTQFRGAIDEVIIFSKVLTPEEILAMSQAYGFEPIVSTDVPGITSGKIVSVYPNPARSILTVSGAENAVVSIYDLNGVMLQSQNSTGSELQLDVAGLKAGLYFLKIKMDNEVRIAKFIKE